MAENIPRNAYWMHDVLRVSEPIAIDGYLWRLVQYRTLGEGGRVDPTMHADYEWQELDDGLQRRRQACSWPGYDASDAVHQGLPHGLRALYDACTWAHPPREGREKPTGEITAVSPEGVHRSIAETLPTLFECAPVPQGGVRVGTPLLSPDGGVVDVFVREYDGEVSVTDLGEALGRLRTQSVDAGRSTAQIRRIEDTCQTLGVALHRGQLLLRVGADGVTAEVVLRVGQAAVRLTDPC